MRCCFVSFVPQWNFPGQDNQVQELLHIANGSDPGNFITLLSVSDRYGDHINQCALISCTVLNLILHFDNDCLDGWIAGRELEQWPADPAGELHGPVGVAGGGVLADRLRVGEHGRERRGPLGHPAAPVGLQHPPRRQLRAACLRPHRRAPDGGQQPAIVQSQRRVRQQHKQPRHLHRAAGQGRVQLRRRPLTFLIDLDLSPPLHHLTSPVAAPHINQPIHDPSP
jgi:hypothetical protein